MRKYISLLILICSLNIYAAELPPAPQPEALQAAVNAFIEAYGTKENITRMTHWDGSIGSPMSYFMSIPFCCDSKDDKLNAVLNAFVTDENNSYQYVHETPGTGLLYSVSFGERRYITRKNNNQEFYMLCVKNLTNPRFRDMYAISFVKKKHTYEGTLFRIKSPRPDYKEEEAKDVVSLKNFYVVGQMDKELIDSVKYVYVNGPNSISSMDKIAWRENVVDGRFVYKDEAYKDSEIWVSYIYKSGKISDRHVVKVIPGAILHVNFHKDGHDIVRVETDYTDDENSKDKQKMTKADETLNNYSVMLKAVNDQIRELRSVPEDAPDHSEVKKRLSELHKTARDITKKMQDLVEKMEKELE